MEQYSLLDLGGLRRRRTLADAIDFLREHADFAEEDVATVHIGYLPLASGRSAGMVQVRFKQPDSNKWCPVPLPSANYFHCDSAEGHRDHCDIYLLDRAVINFKCTVTLSDGQTLRAVEIEPARLPLEPSLLDWQIVHIALECCRISRYATSTEKEVHKRCYRSVREALDIGDSVAAKTIPDLILDFNAIKYVWLPSLDAISAHWREKFPGRKPPSRQKIADALADFGIRFPRRKVASNLPMARQG
jgi:hypothetical protein